MRKHHTKTKGDLGVLKAQVSLAEQGWLSLLPLTEHSSFDLAAYKDGQFRRIQVKYRSVHRGIMQVKFSSSWADKNGNHVVPVNKEEIDLYCVYCPEKDECYWFDPKRFDKTISLRVETSKNNQTSGVNFASDYLRVP